MAIRPIESPQQRVEREFPGLGAMNREDRIDFLLKEMSRCVDVMALRRGGGAP